MTPDDEDDTTTANDPEPMHRAVAFSRTIKDSKLFQERFGKIIDEYQKPERPDDFLSCELEHVDGTMNAMYRSGRLRWLKEDTSADGNICRILTNARCLSEGVDVPALDSVMFLNRRNSVVDVVQAVGRVMRKHKGKNFGYIILPIGIPADMAPEEALKDNKKYKVVWQVLQALRAHDDRFNAIINKLDLNDKRPDQIQVIGVSGGEESDESTKPGDDNKTPKAVQLGFSFPELEDWKDAIFAKIVIKCGSRKYWETWAQDIAKIAEAHISRIRGLLDSADNKYRKRFDEFLTGLREMLNPAITEDDAIEMLAQHLVTKPVFDALFEGYNFTEKNPVSIAMQSMLDVLEGENLGKEAETLEKFYASVRDRASGIDNAEGKQKIIIELYDKFFKTAFPRTADRLGIVYTPVEVVDFIIRSADDALRSEFGVGLTDKNVHVLDPFSGTGTFIVRLLQSGLIQPEDLDRKYSQELHANEVILLAYYIAAVNIEAAYHRSTEDKYRPFDGIVLTDTFQMTETRGTLNEKMFPENNKRAARQNKRDIRVIVGNPPYMAKQASANDANQNLKYPMLDDRIEGSYAARTTATNKNALYDSYIRAIRWASDRIGNEGVICYVTNGTFIDGNSMDGLRASLVNEFTSIHCFNLRGNQRTQGEDSRREGGKIFGSGSRAPIAITLLIKNPNRNKDGNVHYYDIGDYLTREQKLQIIGDFRSVSGIKWRNILPNRNHDWINQRDPAFEHFSPIGDKGKRNDPNTRALFVTFSRGMETARDSWSYNHSHRGLATNMQGMVKTYNEQLGLYKKAAAKSTADKPDLNTILDHDPKRISWTRNLKTAIKSEKAGTFTEALIRPALYRPFCKQHLYFDRQFVSVPGRQEEYFPTTNTSNVVICISGPGGQESSAIIADRIPDVNLQHSVDSVSHFEY